MAYILENARLGGVPIRVAIPPMLAEYATDSISANEKFALDFSSAIPSSARDRTAKAIGSIIIAVAVFEIHADRTAVEIMKPRISRRGLSPIT